jgi:hypothetical protein
MVFGLSGLIDAIKEKMCRSVMYAVLNCLHVVLAGIELMLILVYCQPRVLVIALVLITTAIYVIKTIIKKKRARLVSVTAINTTDDQNDAKSLKID